MNDDQCDTAMRKLASLADATPYQRVYGWRQVLDRIWQAGFEAGYTARSRDEQISERIAEKEKEPATPPEEVADAERTRIAAAFDDLVVTREKRRRFEERHAEHLGDGVTVHGLLRAVVAEIKGMARG